MQQFLSAGFEQVFYATDLDCFVVLEQDGDTLFLQSVVCKKKTAMKKILKRIIMKKETGKFARNIKTEAEFPNSQRNMLYRKRAFSGSCAAQQQTEKIRTEYKNGKTAMEEPPVCLLYFCCFFFRFSLHFRNMKMNFAKKATALAMSVLFAVSMAGCGSSASTAKKVEVTSVEDLADLKIGVQTGTTGDSQASDAVNADSQMQRYNKGADAIQALKNGKIDCVVIDSLPAEKFVAANDDLKIVEGIFDTEEYAMCFKKGNELRDEFNTALAELKEDGTLDEIMSNYIGDEVGQHPYESPADVDRSNGTLTMATNAEFEPWEYKEGTDIVGIDADISQAICDKLGYELKIEDMAFETILASVNSGKADFGAAGMTVTPEREESVDFTDTYANATQVVIVRK